MVHRRFFFSVFPKGLREKILPGLFDMLTSREKGLIG